MSLVDFKPFPLLPPSSSGGEAKSTGSSFLVSSSTISYSIPLSYDPLFKSGLLSKDFSLMNDYSSDKLLFYFEKTALPSSLGPTSSYAQALSTQSTGSFTLVSSSTAQPAAPEPSPPPPPAAPGPAPAPAAAPLEPPPPVVSAPTPASASIDPAATPPPELEPPVPGAAPAPARASEAPGPAPEAAAASAAPGPTFEPTLQEPLAQALPKSSQMSLPQTSQTSAPQQTSMQEQKPSGNWGFTGGQQQKFIAQQVLWMTLLLNQQTPQGATGSLLQNLQLLHSFNQMSNALNELHSQMQQSPANQNGPFIQNLNTLLGAIAKQMQESGTGLISQSAFAKTLQELSGNPIATAAFLKEHCDKLLDQVRENAQVKINEAYAQRGENAAKASPPHPNTAASSSERSSTQTASQDRASAASAAKPSAEREQRIPLQVNGKNQSQQPFLTPQNKNTGSPVLVTVAFPAQHKIQTPVHAGGSKKDSSEKQKDQEEIGGGEEPHTQQMVYIPEGPMILGPLEEPPHIIDIPSFLIATTSVSNAQFADWLNEAYAAKKIRLAQNGVIVDQHGNVICKTHSSSPASQIQICVRNNSIGFDVLPGGELIPVVEVSWFGAQMYCEHYGLRLPTEAEWEKAAGMQPQNTDDEPLVKFRFGTGTHEIDPTRANYRTPESREKQQFPRPRGFYNGQTQFSVENTTYATQDARSPYGCYDMSGNVRQWVDGTEAKKAAKGGSFLTSAEELEVSARALFDPNSCMPDTGFRVALNAE